MEPSTAPIFILGMMRRSGTNFLSDLLTLHPDCVSAAPIHEDFLVARAGHLRRYVDAVTGSWTPTWGVPDERHRLLRHLGDGIAAFLQEGHEAKRVVTKTPRVEHLDLFFRLFPRATLLLLVRDGRNLVASTVRSFDVNEEAARQQWALAGRAILDFDTRNRESGRRYRIIRYEDLHTAPASAMRDVLSVCDLDPARYDFDAAAKLPVRGSSRVRAERAEVHWQAVEKDDAFRPDEHWRDWEPYQHARFATVAGDVQQALGYDLAPAVASSARDRVRDAVDGTSWRIRRLRQRVWLDRKR